MAFIFLPHLGLERGDSFADCEVSSVGALANAAANRWSGSYVMISWLRRDFIPVPLSGFFLICVPLFPRHWPLQALPSPPVERERDQTRGKREDRPDEQSPIRPTA
jgi:hypothetical protein